ncbi:hypothetical protein RHMOL_Rhmol04G0014400 [Rhododendron molle]|nr:hypothetical protein RHMOL_Rhmol04G0014400 [Rhododendron molle]
MEGTRSNIKSGDLLKKIKGTSNASINTPRNQSSTFTPFKSRTVAVNVCNAFLFRCILLFVGRDNSIDSPRCMQRTIAVALHRSFQKLLRRRYWKLNVPRLLPCLSLRKLDFRHLTTPLKRGGECGGKIIFCSFDLSIGKEILILQRECHARRLAEQSVVDRAINDICILLHCSRHNLNVNVMSTDIAVKVVSMPRKVSVGTGLVMGWLRFIEAGRKFDCISSLNTAQPVPVHVEEVKDIVSVAHYILVVEKESVFQRLANDQFCNKNRCIVITVSILLCSVFSCFHFFRKQMAYDAKYLRVPEIHWLGVFPSDSEKYGLPQECLLPLTAEDKSRVEAMLLRCYLQREVPHWR